MANLNSERPLTGGVLYAPVTVRLGNVGLLLAKGEPKCALTHVEELLTYVSQMGLPLYWPEALHLKGQILRRQKQLAAARETWLQALAESEGMEERRMRWQILAALAEVANSADEAADYRKSANEIVSYIAEHAGRPEHKQSFLNRRVVRRLRA